MTKRSLIFILLLFSFAAFASDGPERFAPALLRHGGDYEVRKNALPDLMIELMARTSVNAYMKVKTLNIMDADLFSYPLIFMSGTKSFPAFSNSERDRLRRYLEAGGMLVIDDASGRTGSGFDESVRREMAALFPYNPLINLNVDHAVFRSFFLLRKPFFAGRVLISPKLEGVVLESHTPIIFSKNDAAGSWERDRGGRYINDCLPGGELQRQEGFKFGINSIMYAMTLDYKKDAAHMKALMNRRGR
ncbi:MAG: DUF4159 domain-containing protein [Fibrobacteres bacterium]|nr:DUF4159 domain-containing protein [Fibrobacterota bacterium]